MDNRYIVIHTHMYQPPRENPWLEAIEIQDSASPYHDWNRRVTAECYAANAYARILDGQGKISRIVNNYKDISIACLCISKSFMATTRCKAVNFSGACMSRNLETFSSERSRTTFM